MTASDNPPVWTAGLQLERTSLAWRRLALAFLVLALAVPKLGWPVIGIWTVAPAGVVGVGAITLFAASHRRYLSRRHLLITGVPGQLPDGRLIAIAAVSAVILATLAVVIVTARIA